MSYVIPKDEGLRLLTEGGFYAGVKIINAKAMAPRADNNPYQNQPDTKLDYTKDSPIGISSLGTPIYSDLTLLGCTYTDNLTGNKVTLPNDRYRQGGNSNSQSGSAQKGGFYMNLETIIITIDQPIRIIKTEIQGRDGTVKEYIGKSDAVITINGSINGKNGVYPKDEVARLKAWLDAPVSKGIVAWWLDNVGISNLVVDAYSFPQEEGGYSYQKFAINCSSDAPVELRIIQPLV
jgi:hypothetical protein